MFCGRNVATRPSADRYEQALGVEAVVRGLVAASGVPLLLEVLQDQPDELSVVGDPTSLLRWEPQPQREREPFDVLNLCFEETIRIQNHKGQPSIPARKRLVETLYQLSTTSCAIAKAPRSPTSGSVTTATGMVESREENRPLPLKPSRKSSRRAGTMFRPMLPIT